jgi:hypothetical protein
VSHGWLPTVTLKTLPNGRTYCQGIITIREELPGIQIRLQKMFRAGDREVRRAEDLGFLVFGVDAPMFRFQQVIEF